MEEYRKDIAEVREQEARILRDRKALMVKMRNQGMILKEIGKQFGISAERVRQITLERNGTEPAYTEDQAEIVDVLKKMLAAIESGDMAGAAIAVRYKDGRYGTHVLGEYAEDPVQAAGAVAVLHRELVDNAMMERAD